MPERCQACMVLRRGFTDIPEVSAVPPPTSLPANTCRSRFLENDIKPSR